MRSPEERLPAARPGGIHPLGAALAAMLQVLDAETHDAPERVTPNRTGRCGPSGDAGDHED